MGVDVTGVLFYGVVLGSREDAELPWLSGCDTSRRIMMIILLIF